MRKSLFGIGAIFVTLILSVTSSTESVFADTYIITLENVSEVPSGYTQLEYLQSTGTQWIDTGITATSDMKWVLDNEFTEKPSSGYCYYGGGLWQSLNSKTMRADIAICSNHPAMCYGAWYETSDSSADFVNQRMTYVIDAQNMKWSYGNTEGTFPSYDQYYNTTNSIYLFARKGSAGAEYYSKQKTYSSKFYRSGVLVQNLIPARRNSDNVLGMYDTVSGTFKTNAGTDTFSAGNDVFVLTSTTSTYAYGTGTTIDSSDAGTRTGYTFAGWCTDAELQNCAMTQTISTSDTGDKTFYAKWVRLYTCVAGKYLRGSDATCQDCPVGFYCTGVADVTDTGSDQGISSCSTATSGLYPNSITGATSQNQCYRDCITSDIAYSSTVTGVVYANLTNTCEATTCSTGYNLQPSNTDLLTVIGDTNGITKAATNSSGGTRSGDTSKYGIYGSPQAFAVDYGEKGVLKGHAFCSTTSGSTDNDTWENPSTSETRPGSNGRYCWCHAEEYIPYGGESQSVSAPWIYIYDYGYSGSSSNYCADWCAGNLSTMSPAFRSAVLRTANIESLNGGSCLVASYNITYEMDGGTNYNNAPTTYTYGTGATIDGTPTKSGYTFAGWCTDSELTNCAMTQTIGTDATGDKTFYAKWATAAASITCSAGQYLPMNANACATCTTNSYCAGGEYEPSDSVDRGIVSCATGLYAPVGMWEAAQCGRILHVGDEIVYLHQTKKTTPALHVDIDNDGVADFFGNMTTLDIPMTRGTTRKLKLSFGGQTYSVYDDSVALPIE